MNIKNKSKKNIDDDFDYEIEDQDLNLPSKEYITYNDESILLDLNLSLTHWELSIEALKLAMKERDIDKDFFIKKLNKRRKTLIINDLYIQIAICGLEAEEVRIPLDIWQISNKSPQIILVAQVDDENNIVYFPGVLTGLKFIKFFSENSSNAKNNISIPLFKFDGGIDILFSYAKFLDKKSLPKIGLRKNESNISWTYKTSLVTSFVFTLIFGIFFGENLINSRFAKQGNPILVNEDNNYAIPDNKTPNPIYLVSNFDLSEKCTKNNFSNTTTNMFNKLALDKNINLYNLNCSEIDKINKKIPNSFLTTGRSGGQSVICLTDDKVNNPCQFIIGHFDKNLSPIIALANATGFKLPERDFLNESFGRIFINISETFKE